MLTRCIILGDVTYCKVGEENGVTDLDRVGITRSSLLVSFISSGAPKYTVQRYLQLMQYLIL